MTATYEEFLLESPVAQEINTKWPTMDTVAIDSGKIRSKQKYLLNTSNVFYIPKIVYVTNHKNKSTMKLGCFNNILQNKYIYKMTSTPQHYTHYLHKVTNSRHSLFLYRKTITMEQCLTYILTVHVWYIVYTHGSVVWHIYSWAKLGSHAIVWVVCWLIHFNCNFCQYAPYHDQQ